MDALYFPLRDIPREHYRIRPDDARLRPCPRVEALARAVLDMAPGDVRKLSTEYLGLPYFTPWDDMRRIKAAWNLTGVYRISRRAMEVRRTA